MARITEITSYSSYFSVNFGLIFICYWLSAEPLPRAHGTLQFRVSPVEKHCHIFSHISQIAWPHFVSKTCGQLICGLVRTRILVFDGELSLSHAQPSADGLPLMWVNRPLEVSKPGELSLSSSRGR